MWHSATRHLRLPIVSVAGIHLGFSPLECTGKRRLQLRELGFGMNKLHRLHVALLGWPRFAKRLLMLVLDVSVFPFLMALAFVLRSDDGLIRLSHDLWLLAAAPTLTVATLSALNYYRAVIRYMGAEQVWATLVGMVVSCAALAGLAYMVPAEHAPRSVFIIYGLLGLLYLGGSRFMARRYLKWVIGGYGSRRPVAIYGAGSAGAQAAASLQSGDEFWPVAFVDDNSAMHGSSIQGIKVLGRSGLKKLVSKKQVDTVLLSMPSIPRHRRLEVVYFLEQLHVKVKSIPGLSDIIHDRARIEEVRDVALEDLLGRDAVPPNDELLHKSVTGKNILVSGAGGSIGSELCRQLLALKPTSLTLFEQSEYSLYAIEREVGPICQKTGVQLHVVLGSVVNKGLVQSVLVKYRVDTVYHAAAYKHVPIVEGNPLAGIENNVLGTLAMAEAAELAAVERFILISTDKAVRPTNVMGASKRLAEMVLQSIAARDSKTVFTMVRFGNVLGSSGSVVPVFREQIRQGGPVTVTHPDVIRYFMTIPEAAQLVIQAGSMASGGEVFVLDMGEPVRIFDLACTMVHLMGLSVKNDSFEDGDIEIQFSGLRPGEKLYEELLIGEDSVGTQHAGIMQAHEEFLPWQELSRVIDQLEQLVINQDGDGVRSILNMFVTGYNPAPLAESLFETGFQDRTLVSENTRKIH